MHEIADLKVMYFGTPVVLVSSQNEDNSTNLMPMSSAWWLGSSCMLGIGSNSQTRINLLRERECVLNLVPAALVDAVDRLALLTGRPVVDDYRIEQGYRYERDKFGAAGLTEQTSDLVGTPRVKECPIQLECVVDRTHAFGYPEPDITAFEVHVVRTHIEKDLIIPNTHYIDPLRWDPLIMKFCEFFGSGENVHASKLAKGWSMPHEVQASSA